MHARAGAILVNARERLLLEPLLFPMGLMYGSQSFRFWSCSFSALCKLLRYSVVFDCAQLRGPAKARCRLGGGAGEAFRQAPTEKNERRGKNAEQRCRRRGTPHPLCGGEGAGEHLSQQQHQQSPPSHLPVFPLPVVAQLLICPGTPYTLTAHSLTELVVVESTLLLSPGG